MFVLFRRIGKNKETKKIDKVKKNNVKPKNPLIFGKGIDRYFDDKFRKY